MAPPPALKPVQHPPRDVGSEQASWRGKVVRRFVSERFGRTLERGACRNYLHRLGFVGKRPTKRLLKADAAKRSALVEEYADLRSAARTSGATHFFVDEAHFHADVDPPACGCSRAPRRWRTPPAPAIGCQAMQEAA